MEEGRSKGPHEGAEGMVMKKLHISVALVTFAGLLALWAARARTGISQAPRAPQSQRSGLEPVPEMILPSMPVSVPALGTSSVHPVEKSTASPDSEAQAIPSAKLQKRISAIKQDFGDPGEAKREAIRATAEYLSIQPASLLAFEEAARQSVLELEMALAARKGDLAGLAPKGLSPPEASNTRRLAEARYAATRRNALDRLQPFLSGCTNAQEFQWGFDSWAATVSAQAQPVNTVSAGK
jgi:hypothetical protein